MSKQTRSKRATAAMVLGFVACLLAGVEGGLHVLGFGGGLLSIGSVMLYIGLPLIAFGGYVKYKELSDLNRQMDKLEKLSKEHYIASLNEEIKLLEKIILAKNMGKHLRLSDGDRGEIYTALTLIRARLAYYRSKIGYLDDEKEKEKVEAELNVLIDNTNKEKLKPTYDNNRLDLNKKLKPTYDNRLDLVEDLLDVASKEWGLKEEQEDVLTTFAQTGMSNEDSVDVVKLSKYLFSWIYMSGVIVSALIFTAQVFAFAASLAVLLSPPVIPFTLIGILAVGAVLAVGYTKLNNKLDNVQSELTQLERENQTLIENCGAARKSNVILDNINNLYKTPKTDKTNKPEISSSKKKRHSKKTQSENKPQNLRKFTLFNEYVSSGLSSKSDESKNNKDSKRSSVVVKR